MVTCYGDGALPDHDDHDHDDVCGPQPQVELIILMNMDNILMNGNTNQTLTHSLTHKRKKKRKSRMIGKINQEREAERSKLTDKGQSREMANMQMTGGEHEALFDLRTHTCTHTQTQ